MKIVPYQPAHARKIIAERVRLHDLWLRHNAAYIKWPEEWAKYPAYTLLINDKIILCGGVMLLDWHRGEAWTLFANNYRKYPIACFKACKWVLDKVTKECDLRRIQVLVEPNINGAQNFIRRFGFEKEGLLRAFGPEGEDLYIFSKIIKDE